MRLLFAIFLAAMLAGWPGPDGLPASAGQTNVTPQASEWTDVRLEHTDPLKLFDIGKSHALGKDVPMILGLATRMFESAHQRMAWLASEIGRFYTYEAKDADRAIYWYKAAIAQGDKLAYASLGNLDFSGRLVSRNYAMARHYYLKSTGWRAPILLGKIFLKGLGTNPSHESAKQWFLEAARRGNRWSMQEIGETYLKANGIDSEFDTEALAWLIASMHFNENRISPQVDALNFG